MELYDFVSIIRKYRRMIAGTTIIAAVVALLATYILPTIYVASVTLRLKPEETKLFGVQISDVAALPISKDPVATGAGTISDMFANRALAKQVVIRLKLDKEKPPKSLWKWLKKTARNTLFDTWTFLKYGMVKKLSPMEEATQGVMRSLSAEPVENTLLVKLSAAIEDPVLAAAIANVAADKFVIQRRTAAVEESKTKILWLEREIALAEKKLVMADAEVQTYKEGANIAGFQEEIARKVAANIDLQIAQQTNTDASSAKKKALSEVMDQFREELRNAPRQERELADLVRNANEAEDFLARLRKYLADTEILLASGASGVQIIDKAQAPTYPSKPIKVYYGGGGAIFGFLIALGFALSNEYYLEGRRESSS